MKKKNKMDKKLAPDISCPTEYPEIKAAAEKAYNDYLYSEEYKIQRSGDFHCFCKNSYIENLFTVNKILELPEDQQDLCFWWYEEYKASMISMYSIGLSIFIMNIAFCEVTIKVLERIKIENEQYILIQKIIAFSLQWFLNMLILMLISFRFKNA